MNVPKYDPTDLCCDLYLKYSDSLNAELVEDITTVINIAFEDGYCRGYNSANEWYSAMDADIEYIKSFDNDVEGSVQGVDTFNDDLVGTVYGDMPSLDDLNLYYSVNPFKDKEDFYDSLGDIDLDKPLDDNDE